MQRRAHSFFSEAGGARQFFGSRFGGNFAGGMRAAKMLASGDLQLIVLLLLSEKPRHGYEIIKAIEEHSSGVYTPSPGMVYPALTYLEEMGYASASTEGVKKLYSISEAGAAYLAGNRAGADEVWNQLGAFGRRFAQFRRQFTEDEDAADQFASDPRGAAREEWRQMRGEFRSLRDELKSVIFEKLDASFEEKKRILAILRRTIDEIRGN